MVFKFKPIHKEILKSIGINYHDFKLISISIDNLKLQDRKTNKIIDVRY